MTDPTNAKSANGKKKYLAPRLEVQRLRTLPSALASSGCPSGGPSCDNDGNNNLNIHGLPELEPTKGR